MRGESRGFFKAIVKFNNNTIQNPEIAVRIREIEETNNVEYISVKVNGEVKDRRVDNDQNECNLKVLANVLNKNKCGDIFLNIKKIVNDNTEKIDDG